MRGFRERRRSVHQLRDRAAIAATWLAVRRGDEIRRTIARVGERRSGRRAGEGNDAVVTDVPAATRGVTGARQIVLVSSTGLVDARQTRLSVAT